MARSPITLPYDILCVVASFITSGRDLTTFCLASRETRDAAIPHIYSSVFFESLPDGHPETSTGSAELFRVSHADKILLSALYKDLKKPLKHQERGIHVKSLRHVDAGEGVEGGILDTREVFKNRLVYLIETLPRLKRLSVTTADLLVPSCEEAISNSETITHLALVPQNLNASTFESRRLAESAARFLPLWGNIASPLLKSLTITSLPPSHRTVLDRTTVLGSVELWRIISNCPNLKHLDIRVKISGRDRGHNYIKDLAGRLSHGAIALPTNPANEGVPGPVYFPVVHLDTLRLDNCTMSAFELNRLNPTTWKSLHIPYNGRKKLFKELGNLGTTSTGERSLLFPKNLKSLVVDSLPLTPDRKEAWHRSFEQEFAELKLEELVVITKKSDFWVGGTPSGIVGFGTTRDGGDLSPNTRNEAVGMITGVNTLGSTKPSASTSRGEEEAEKEAAGAANIGSTGLELGMGSWLKRLLLKGSWAMTSGLMRQLMATCWGLEEFGVALLWREWGHKVSNVHPMLKRLRQLKAFIILNEPTSTNQNAEWGLPLPTKNKVWGSKLELKDDGFLQYGQPQERLKYWGVGKKMWAVVLEEEKVGLRTRWVVRGSGVDAGEGSSKGGTKLRRVLREVDRESVDGVAILEWIRFCDEGWIAEGDEKGLI